ncbi:MAG: hypothetical protein P1U63_03260 [Coxiellaceae bacterium]|nr:hypothetical protein [Coxiellaceae bacterium]
MAMPRIIQVNFKRKYPVDTDGYASDDGSVARPLRLFPLSTVSSLAMSVELFFNMDIKDHFPFNDKHKIDLTHTYALLHSTENNRLCLFAYRKGRELDTVKVLQSIDELRGHAAFCLDASDRAFVAAAMMKFFAGSAVSRPYDWLQANLGEKKVYTIDDWHADMPRTVGGRENLFKQKKHDRERLRRIEAGELPKEGAEEKGMELMDDDADTLPYDTGSPRF